MCKAWDDYANECAEIAAKKAAAKAAIESTIETAIDFGGDNIAIVNKLCKKFNLTLEEAEQKYEEFLNTTATS